MYKNQATVFQTSFVFFNLGHHKDKPNWDHKPTGEWKHQQQPQLQASKNLHDSAALLNGGQWWTITTKVK